MALGLAREPLRGGAIPGGNGDHAAGQCELPAIVAAPGTGMREFGGALSDPAPYLKKKRGHHHQHNRSPNAKPDGHLNAIATPVHSELAGLIGKPRGKAADNNQKDKGGNRTGHALARPTNRQNLGAEII